MVKRLAVMACCVLYAAPVLCQVSSTKRSDDDWPGQWYGTLELRHHINTFYDQDDYLARQDPSAHARIQLGAQLYEGTVDVYTTLGVFKRPRTQQILQRRPEMALDYYPWRSAYGNVLLYNLVRVPFANEDEDREAEDEVLGTGTVYTIGFAPTLKYPITAAGYQWQPKTGLDLWTRLYSRPQYTTEYDLDGESPGDRDQFALDDSGDAKPIEAYAPTYNGLYFVGLAVDPTSGKGAHAELSGYYKSVFHARYVVDDDETVSHEYGADRYSYYRLRLKYDLSDDLAILNDFYHFHEGAFEAKRREPMRRFRNIARVTLRL